MSTALTKITTRAKAIRSKHPRMDWKTAVQTASKEYKRGKLSGPKKRTANKAVRKAVRKSSSRTHRSASKKAAGVFAGNGTLGSHISAGQKIIENQIGALVVRQIKAKGVRNKRKLGKQINEQKSKLRKLCNIK